eukprot:g4289.t1
MSSSGSSSPPIALPVSVGDATAGGLISPDGWFSEKEAMWPGQRFGLKVKQVLFEGRTKFQHVLIFDSETYGRVLVLDGVIQLTERDEHAYQEMITHVPLFSHANPERVLVIGGGDGGVVREVARHACVKTIVQCEIDGEVLELAKQFFAGSTATAYDDPRLQLNIEDAAKFVPTQVDAPYDVIIVDSSDPVGPAEVLFKDEFYDSLRTILKPGGIICNQGECVWLHLPLIKGVLDHCAATFAEARYFYTTVPTYPSGQIGFFLCRHGAADGGGEGKDGAGVGAGAGAGAGAVGGQVLGKPNPSSGHADVAQVIVLARDVAGLMQMGLP